MHHRFFSCASACSPSYRCVYDITFVFTVCFFDLFFLLELLQIRAWSSFIVGRSWLVPSSSMMAFALRTSSSSAFWLRVTGGGLIWAPFPLRFIQLYLKLLCFSTCAYGMFANSSFAPSATRALFTVFSSCGSLPLSSLNVIYFPSFFVISHIPPAIICSSYFSWCLAAHSVKFWSLAPLITVTQKIWSEIMSFDRIVWKLTPLESVITWILGFCSVCSICFGWQCRLCFSSRQCFSRRVRHVCLLLLGIWLTQLFRFTMSASTEFPQKTTPGKTPPCTHCSTLGWVTSSPYSCRNLW